MHNCDHIPPDPKLVLAMCINARSYDIYLALPAKTHHDLSIVNNGYIVVPVDTPNKWGWMTNADFIEAYQYADVDLVGQFKLYKAR